MASLGWGWGCCCGVSSNAYHCGGYNASPEVTVDRTVFSTDATSAVASANLSSGRGGGESQGIGNPDVAGYLAGGYSAGFAFTNKADKLTFSSETSAAMTTANLSTNRSQLTALSERSTKGYFFGGLTAAAGRVTTADQLTFSSDTTAAQTSANLSASRYDPSGLSEGATKGYIGGGLTTSTAAIATSDKIVFSSDTTSAQASANLTTARGQYHPMSDGSTKGYWAGGASSTQVSLTDKVTFSTDTTSSVASLAILRQLGGGCSNGTKGYIAGGINSSIAITVSMVSVDFALETLTSIGAVLSSARIGVCSISMAGL